MEKSRRNKERNDQKKTQYNQALNKIQAGWLPIRQAVTTLPFAYTQRSLGLLCQSLQPRGVHLLRHYGQSLCQLHPHFHVSHVMLPSEQRTTTSLTGNARKIVI